MAWSCQRPSHDGQTELRGETMGTTYTVKVVSEPALGADDARSLQSAIDRRLASINGAMSTYLPDSEVSRFGARESTDPFPISEDTLAVLSVAQEVSAQSDGAFDVTVAPLVDAWGFGPDARPPAPPSEAALDALRRHVGYQSLVLDPASSTVAKRDPAVAIDLSAVAKGYAVDAVSELLAERGFVRSMIEIGGEVRVRGLNAAGEPWRIAVERPTVDPQGARAIQRVLPITDLSMATSGDYRNFYVLDGARYSHTIDPATGRPVTHQAASVTVLYQQCSWADAYATTLMVMGPERGLSWANARNLAVLFLVFQGGSSERDANQSAARSEAQLIEVASTAMRDYLNQAENPS